MGVAKTGDIEVVEAKAWQGGVMVTFEDGESTFFPGYLLYAARGLAAVLNMDEDKHGGDKPGAVG